MITLDEGKIFKRIQKGKQQKCFKNRVKLEIREIKTFNPSYLVEEVLDSVGKPAVIIMAVNEEDSFQVSESVERII